MKIVIPKNVNLDLLKSNAISAMAYARPRRSNLPVGCAILDTKNTIFTGANVEFLFQQSWHAEEVAYGYAMSHDGGKIIACCIASDRKRFTPCGKCRDPIKEFSIPECLVVHVNPRTKKTLIFTIDQLMPYYPTKE